MIRGNALVGVGSALAASEACAAFVVASGKRAFISRKKPSRVSTLAAIFAISANWALSVTLGLLAVSKAARAASPLMTGAYFSRNRARPIVSSASREPTQAG